MKVTIEKAYRKEEQGAKGPYTRLGLKTKEYGEEWLSGFDSKFTASWKEGDVVEVEVTKAEKVNPKTGKPYLNFKTLAPWVTRKEFEDLLARVVKLEGPVVAPALETDTAGEINIEDIPF